MSQIGCEQAGLEVQGISKAFGSTQVLDKVSLSVSPGTIVALLGPNGAGKSTLFRVLMGLIPADCGCATMDGHDILGSPLHEKAAQGLGYLPQESSSFADLSARDNLLALLELVETSSAERDKRAAELLELTGLVKGADRPCRVLSTGEQRRLMVAKALVAAPRILLLDEPFSGLDPRITEELAVVLQEMAGRGVGILLTDHNVHAALAIVERVYVIADGRLVRMGPPHEILADAEVKCIYLGGSFPELR